MSKDAKLSEMLSKNKVLMVYVISPKKYTHTKRPSARDSRCALPPNKNKQQQREQLPIRDKLTFPEKN